MTHKPEFKELKRRFCHLAHYLMTAPEAINLNAEDMEEMLFAYLNRVKGNAARDFADFVLDGGRSEKLPIFIDQINRMNISVRLTKDYFDEVFNPEPEPQPIIRRLGDDIDRED